LEQIDSSKLRPDYTTKCDKFFEEDPENKPVLEVEDDDDAS